MTLDVLETTTLTIERTNDSSSSRNVIGEVDRSDSTFSAANRGALPKSAQGRPTVMTTQDRIAFGVTTTQLGWIIRSRTDLQCNTLDRIVWTDQTGTERIVRVTQETHRKNPTTLVYRTIGIEDQARE